MLFLFTMCLCSVMSGCNDASDSQSGEADHGHDHDHDHSARLPFGALVGEIAEHSEEIKAAFDGGNKDEAHDPLHEIGHLVQQLPEAAAETDLAEADWNAVKEASEKLMEAFGKVDALFHDDEGGSTFAEVEEDVQAAMAVLQEKLALTTDAGEESQP